MTKLYLHIGLQKTATTLIQKVVYTLRDQVLDETGLLYPLAGIPDRMIAHHGLTWALRKKNSAEATGIIEAIGEEARSTRAERILLSTEGLSGSDVALELPFLFEALREFETEIIVYLRNPFHFLESLLYQYIKLSTPWRAAWTGSLDEFLDKELERCDFYAFCERWASFVGWENLRVRVYDREIRDYGILQSFFEATQLPDYSGTLPDVRRANVRQDFKAARMGLAMNRLENRFPGFLAKSRFWKKARYHISSGRIGSLLLDALPTGIVENVEFNRRQLERIREYSTVNAKLYPKVLSRDEVDLLMRLPSAVET